MTKPNKMKPILHISIPSQPSAEERRVMYNHFMAEYNKECIVLLTFHKGTEKKEYSGVKIECLNRPIYVITDKDKIEYQNHIDRVCERLLSATAVKKTLTEKTIWK